MCRTSMTFVATVKHIPGQVKIQVYCEQGNGHKGQHEFNPNYTMLDGVDET